MLSATPGWTPPCSTRWSTPNGSGRRSRLCRAGSTEAATENEANLTWLFRADQQGPRSTNSALWERETGGRNQFAVDDLDRIRPRAYGKLANTRKEGHLSALFSGWWACADSNCRPLPCQNSGHHISPLFSTSDFLKNDRFLARSSTI